MNECEHVIVLDVCCTIKHSTMMKKTTTKTPLGSPIKILKKRKESSDVWEKDEDFFFFKYMLLLCLFWSAYADFSGILFCLLTWVTN